MHRWRELVVVLSLVLVMAAPAAAKEKEPKLLVPVASSGQGVAPTAPAWVREKIKKIHAGAIESGDSEEPSRTLQGQRRVSWSGCRDVWAYRGYDHFLGYNLFRYYQQVSWCSNGFSIYSWGRFRWPVLNGPGWAFDGHIGSYLGGSLTTKQAWTQGAFHACIVGFCDYKVPWVNIDVTVNGSWAANTGG